MDTWRSFLVELKNHWNNFRRKLQPYFNYDYDRYLNLLMIGAGIRPIPGGEPWKRYCLILYRLLGFYQIMLSMARVVFSVRNGSDTFTICVPIVMLITQIAVSARVYILGYYDEAVRQAKTFVNSNLSFSGDPDYDDTVRRGHAGVPGKMSLIVLVILCYDQMIISIPSSARDSIFGIPEEFDVLGPMITRLMQEMYVFLNAFFWGCGYYSIPLTILPLLNGLKHELMIVGRGYEMVVSLDDQNNAPGTSRKLSEDVLMLKHLKQKLGITVEQHVEVMRILHLVQPLVSNLYAIIYFSVMIIVSVLVFVLIKSEMTLVNLAICASTSLFLVECYVWCRMIDSVQETMETIADCVAPLAFRMQHSEDNHSGYIEMRTSIMIVQLSAAQGDFFNCGGMFPISVKSFGDLCMLIYRFATFLLNSE